MSSYFRGTKRVAAAINKYADGLHKTAMEACQNIAWEMQQEAEDRYADYDGPDGNDVIVDDPELLKQGAIPVGYKVRAYGQPIRDAEDHHVVGNTIVFEEFGSGLLAGSHPLSTHFEGIYPGSWSESAYGTHEYASTGRWHYEGTEYVYIAPTYAMYLAGQRGREIAMKELKEVLK